MSEHDNFSARIRTPAPSWSVSIFHPVSRTWVEAQPLRKATWLERLLDRWIGPQHGRPWLCVLRGLLLRRRAWPKRWNSPRRRGVLLSEMRPSPPEDQATKDYVDRRA